VTERERQRRLHVQNRLEELRRKHGWEQLPMPPWLDTLEGWQETHAAAPSESRQEPQQPQEAAKPAQEPPRRAPTPRAPGRPQKRGADW